MDLFSSRDLGGGRRGLFHPDNLTFGQSIYISQMIAAANNIDGIENVVVTRLSRRGSDVNVAIPPDATSDSAVDPPNYLEISPGEIAQLDNSGSDLGGTFCLALEGGK
jgi:hypothetical protein